ncbi:MAG: radical SAM protein [Proteobacteria bacterium]|nr:radical SAM protein [Pseudomonadota bacterium]
MHARYLAEPIAWVEVDGDTIALNQRRPAWACVNDTALWIVQFLEREGGATVQTMAARYREMFDDIADDEMGAVLESLEGVGLVRRQAEQSPPVPSQTPDTGQPISEPSDAGHDYGVEHIYIELLARCNLRCIHCFMEGAPDRTELLERHEVERILHQFSAGGGRYVTLSGGEPLLYREFEAIAREVAALGLLGTVVSNGTVLRDHHLALIDELGFNLAISVDGVSAPVNDRIRGPGTHRRIMAAVDRALAVIGPHRFILSFSPSRRNLDEIPALFMLARERGIRRLNLSLIEDVGRASDHRDDLALSESDRVRIIDMVYSQALTHLGAIEVDFNDTRNILEVFRTNRPLHSLHPLWRGIRLDSRGDVYPSTLSSATAYRLGNVRDSSLAEIMASPILTELYSELHDRFLHINRCRECAWRQLCRGGSVTSAYYSTGSLLAPDAYCAGYLETFPRVAVRLANLARGGDQESAP